MAEGPSTAGATSDTLFSESTTRYTLLHALSMVKLAPGINEHLFDSLSNALTSNNFIRRTYCALLFDEINLIPGLTYCHQTKKISGYVDIGDNKKQTQLADRALVFMIKGLNHKRKQPIAYYFTKGSMSADLLKNIIIQLIKKLRKSNIHILVLISNHVSAHAPVMMRLHEELGQDNNGLYFELEGHKVFYIRDPHHLFVDLRNVFMKYDIEFDPEDSYKKAKWSNLVTTFQNFEQLFNKSYYRFKPEHFTEISDEVHIARQQLSFTMCNYIILSISTGSLPEEAEATTNFIDDMEKLFYTISGLTKYRHKNLPIPIKKSEYIQFWYRIFAEMSLWKLYEPDKYEEPIDRTGIQCLDDWAHVLKWMIAFFTYLESVTDFNSSLGSIGQVVLNNFFVKIRRKRNNVLKCNQFISSLKLYLFNHSHRKTDAKYEDKDWDKYLPIDNSSYPEYKNENSKDLIINFKKIIRKEGPCNSWIPMFEFPETDTEDYDLDDFNGNFNAFCFVYASDSILKPLKPINCTNCQSVLLDLVHISSNATSVAHPAPRLIDFVEIADKKATKYLEKVGSMFDFDKLYDLLKDDFKVKCSKHRKLVLRVILKRTIMVVVNKFCSNKH